MYIETAAGMSVIVNVFTFQKHRVPVQAILCLEKWLFQEERCQLADQWHHTAGERKGSLIMLCEIRCKYALWNRVFYVVLVNKREIRTSYISYFTLGSAQQWAK